MGSHEISDQRLKEYIVDDIRRSSPELNAWLAANGHSIDLGGFIRQLCDRCVNGSDNERCQSLRSLNQIQSELRVHPVHLTNDTFDAIVRSLQHVTEITESDSSWNLELVDALDAYGQHRPQFQRPFQRPLIVSLLLQLHDRLPNSADRVSIFAAFRSCGKDAASAAVPVLAESLRSESDIIVLESLTTLAWLAEDGRPAVAEIVEVIIGEHRVQEISVQAAATLVKCLAGEIGNCLDALSPNELAMIIDTLRNLGDSDVALEARRLRQDLEKCILPGGNTDEPEPDRHECVAEYESYSQFGLGIHYVRDRPQYLLFSLRQVIEGVVEVGSAINVPFTQPRLQTLFRLLMASADGQTASKESLMIEFGILSRMTTAMRRQQSSDEPDSSLELEIPSMEIRSGAFHALSNAMATLGSNFREKVNVRCHGPGNPTFFVDGSNYRSAFVVRALVQRENGRYTFGQRD